MTRADQILARAEALAAKHGESRYAAEAGTLRGEVRTLCWELAQYENPSSLDHYDVMLDGRTPIQVGASFARDDRWSPVYVDRMEVYIAGIDVEAMLSEDDREAIREDVIAQYVERCRSLVDPETRSREAWELDREMRERERLDAIEHAQDRDYWRTERERLDALEELEQGE